MKEKDKLTKENYKKLLEVFNEDHMKLVGWLYKKHPKVWHQYEKEEMNGLKLRMLENEFKKNKKK